jgi:hypothetical protein
MKISLQRVSTKDLATLTERTITLSTSGKYPVLANHPLMNELTTHYAAYDAVYTKKTFSGKGKDVAAADHDRDVAFSCIKAFLNGYRQIVSVPNFQDAERSVSDFCTVWFRSRPYELFFANSSDEKTD